MRPTRCLDGAGALWTPLRACPNPALAHRAAQWHMGHATARECAWMSKSLGYTGARRGYSVISDQKMAIGRRTAAERAYDRCRTSRTCGRRTARQQPYSTATTTTTTTTTTPTLRDQPVRAFIALGSNMHNRLSLIESACRLIDTLPTTRILRTSSIWETKAMYVLDQDDFLNGVCEIETQLAPLALLDALQGIEVALQRRKVVEKGPRTIDLDVLLYGDEVVSEERLIVPHPLMLEREFVLNPLCELIPDTHPPSSNTIYTTYLSRLQQTTNPSSLMYPLTFLRHASPPLSPLLPSRITRLMAILNTTPDSFSDGAPLSTFTDAHLTQRISALLAAGASLIDIGGESTRPGATPVGAAEERRRVERAVRIAAKLCAEHGDGTAVVSVDTYRAEVADAALSAGASVVNDVSAGTLDADLFDVVARHNAAVVLMHWEDVARHLARHPDGASTPSPATTTTTTNEDIIHNIITFLTARVSAAEQVSIRRWRILLDPGFGFSKTAATNVELLRRWSELRGAPALRGMPWLLGVSRKRFVGGLSGGEEGEWRWEEGRAGMGREEGTDVAHGVVLGERPDVLRVHDVTAARRLVERIQQR